LQKYKTYILIGLICFTLGFCCFLLSSRGELSNLRIRADQVDANNRQLRSQLESSQKQLTKLKATIGATGKTVARIGDTTSNVKKSNRAARESVGNAIGKIESSGDEFDQARAILSAVQKRGRK
jgi:septal ring factor EnvC (AmiA/AmiB activator)